MQQGGNVPNNFDWEAARAVRIAYGRRQQAIERRLLDGFMAGATGPVCDLGCGRGDRTAYLHAQGREVVGADLAIGPLEKARRLHPNIPFIHVDMQRLPFENGTLAGVVALYIHGLVQHNLRYAFHREVSLVLSELARVLRPAGELLVGFLRGDEAHITWEGEDITFSSHFCTPQEMSDWLTQAGFSVIAITDSMPDADTGKPSLLIYIHARKSRNELA